MKECADLEIVVFFPLHLWKIGGLKCNSVGSVWYMHAARGAVPQHHIKWTWWYMVSRRLARGGRRLRNSNPEFKTNLVCIDPVAEGRTTTKDNSEGIGRYYRL